MVREPRSKGMRGRKADQSLEGESCIEQMTLPSLGNLTRSLRNKHSSPTLLPSRVSAGVPHSADSTGNQSTREPINIIQ